MTVPVEEVVPGASGLGVLLLHGFPASSHMFRHLIPALADQYHDLATQLADGFSGRNRARRASGKHTYPEL